MLPLFKEDAILATRIMVVVPIVKVCVSLVLTICIFVRRVVCFAHLVRLGWVIWRQYANCSGKWHVIVGADFEGCEWLSR
jgi:hypothetical protein